MTKPSKARTPKRTDTFRETLAPSFATPAAPTALRLPAVSPRVWLIGLIAVWALATVLAGIGLGRLLASRSAAPAAEAPVPVATASLKAAAFSTPSSITVSHVAPAATIVPAGSPIETAAIGTYQAATGLDALQPGFTPYLRSPQGTVGTAPVVR